MFVKHKLKWPTTSNNESLEGGKDKTTKHKKHEDHPQNGTQISDSYVDTYLRLIFSLLNTHFDRNYVDVCFKRNKKTIMFLNIHKVYQVCALQCVIFLLSYFFMLMKLMGSQIVLANELSRWTMSFMALSLTAISHLCGSIRL